MWLTLGVGLTNLCCMVTQLWNAVPVNGGSHLQQIVQGIKAEAYRSVRRMQRIVDL